MNNLCTKCGHPCRGEYNNYTPHVCHGCYDRQVRRDHADMVADILNTPSDEAFSKADAQVKRLGCYYTGNACSNDRHPEIRAVHGSKRCLACHGPRAIARANGLPTYAPPTACPLCGLKAPRTVTTDKCTGCPDKRRGGARAQARRKGATRYTPDAPCPDCGERAERRTQDDRCFGCAPLRKAGTGDGVTAQFMADNPELVVSRDDAITYGFKVYRTGTACKRGHVGYRYVTTRNCVECRRVL